MPVGWLRSIAQAVSDKRSSRGRTAATDWAEARFGAASDRAICANGH